MKNRWNIGGIAFLLSLVSSHAWAQTYSTNIKGVILKNVVCNGGFITLNVSNKTNQKLSGDLLVTIFDSEGDPIDSGSTFISVGPVSGDSEKIYVSCRKASKLTFRINN